MSAPDVAGSVPERDRPLDWAIVPGITKPMFVVLVGAHQTGRIDPLTYPGGQLRLILQGLRTRELLDETGALTEAGIIAARRCDAEVRRAYPESPR
jgi:hypothetical protein